MTLVLTPRDGAVDVTGSLGAILKPGDDLGDQHAEHSSRQHGQTADLVRCKGQRITSLWLRSVRTADSCCFIYAPSRSEVVPLTLQSAQSDVNP